MKRAAHSTARSLEIAFLKAKAAQHRGDLPEARRLYTAILSAFPKNARAKRGLESLTRQQSAHVSGPADGELGELIAWHKAGRFEDVIAGARSLLARHPNSLPLYDLIGSGSAMLGRVNDAIEAYRKAAEINPGLSEAHNNLGVQLLNAGHIHEATASFKSAIRLSATNAEAHFNHGLSLLKLGHPVEAIDAFQRALEIRPDLAEAHNSTGTALQALGRADEAISCYIKALELRPNFAPALSNIGTVWQSRGRHSDAITWFERALKANPGDTIARSQKLLQQAHICDWSELATEAAFLSELGVTEGIVSPFAMLALDDDPARQRARAERFAAREFGPGREMSFVRPKARPERLRVGYFSSEFYEHATMFLAARLFELHDRSRFEVHLFSYGPERDDPMRRRLEAAADRFHDVRELSDSGVAELARREQLDIAVDLKGYTQNNRLGIFAWRPAPIQVSYLGYPGTLGTEFIDYIVADRMVIPPEQREHYSESVVFLPDSYQANDNTRPLDSRSFTRTEVGLPDVGFVFSSFNNSYKITAAEFDIWMRLLHQVEGSVLWLLEANEWAESNLRKEAAQRGVEPKRLVFAPRLPAAEHLARHRLADLFLDTFTVNAHTTASDALWAGLPVVTKCGQSFAARVASSLLSAVGMPELVAATEDEYEEIALDLATNRKRLTKLRADLASKRSSTPLFQSDRFTRNLERAYDEAHARFLAGGLPGDISICS